jgi:hypothetical protein
VSERGTVSDMHSDALVIAVAIVISVIVLAGLAVFAFDGFRNGDFTGEALARALREDLTAATRRDRGAGRS